MVLAGTGHSRPEEGRGVNRNPTQPADYAFG